MFGRLLNLIILWFTALAPAWAQTVLLDGKPIAVEAMPVEGGHFLDAAPIMDALGNSYTFLDGALEVVRQPDNAVFTLAVEDGLVSVGGKPLGRLEVFGEVGEDTLLLTPNALAVLTGLKVDYDEETNTYELELDSRLKTSTGFELFINGAPLLDPKPEPRAVGSVTLLPLIPIAEELGSTVTVIDGGGSVRVDRVQDSAAFVLDLQTGLVKLRDNPVGIVPGMSYADPVNLLLPKAAVEALTGTRVKLAAGTSRIDIDLDTRLADAVAPGDGVLEEAANTPFTPESLIFELGPRSLNRVEGDFRYRGLNGRVRAELPDLPNSLQEAEPSWLSLDFAHVNGIGGSLGDIAPRHRELSGVGGSRIRGLALEEVREKGRMAVVMGVPQNGSRRIGKDQSRQTFGGFAAGARWADADGWEAGAAIRHDAVTEEQRLVLSAISGRLGRPLKSGALSWDAQGDLGYFLGHDRPDAVDLRTSLAARKDLGGNVRINAGLRYSGGNFQTALLDSRRLREDILLADGDVVDEPLEPEFSRRGEAQLDASVGLSWNQSQVGPIVSPSFTLDAESSHSGDRVRDRISAGAGGTLGATGIGLNSSYSHFTTRGTDQSGSNLVVQARKSFQRADMKAQYARTDDTIRVREIISASVTANPVNFRLPKNMSMSVGPSVTGALIDGQGSLRAGLRARVDSGKVFGPRNRVTASLGILNSVTTRGDARVDEYLSVSMLRNVALGDNIAVGFGLNSDLRGNVDVGLRLRGRFDFNPKRRLRRTEADAGVLSGVVFVDANRNGVRDMDEQVAPGVKLSLQNTPWSLRADAGGNFTVQNLPLGLYEVRVDGKSLPLGYAQSEDAPRRATVADGRITTLDIPIVARGQLRGFVFRDTDGDGEYVKGDVRPEDETVELQSSDGKVWTARTTSFGQFAFDDLATGTYRVFYRDQEILSVDLDDYPSLLGKVRVPLPPDDNEHQEGVAVIATP